MKHEPDIEGLEDFFHEGDKNSPRFLAGRREIISAIEETVDKLCKQIDQLPVSEVHPKQSTWLIQGAPGAGKNHFAVAPARSLVGEQGRPGRC